MSFHSSKRDSEIMLQTMKHTRVDSYVASKMRDPVTQMSIL